MPKRISSFQSFTDDQSARYHANHWPTGRLVAKRFVKGKNFYQFIKSIAVFIQVITGDVLMLVRNRDISQADELLEEWETSVGIPDQIPRRDTMEGRREAVQCLISKVPVVNIDDGEVEACTTFENYVKCLTGLEIEIRTSRITDGKGSDFVQEFPVQFGFSSARGNFKFIIGVPVSGQAANNSFPLPFPVNFFDPRIPDATMDLLDIVLERVIPSFGYWIYEAVIE